MKLLHTILFFIIAGFSSMPLSGMVTTSKTTCQTLLPHIKALGAHAGRLYNRNFTPRRMYSQQNSLIAGYKDKPDPLATRRKEFFTGYLEVEKQSKGNSMVPITETQEEKRYEQQRQSSHKHHTYTIHGAHLVGGFGLGLGLVAYSYLNKRQKQQAAQKVVKELKKPNPNTPVITTAVNNLTGTEKEDLQNNQSDDQVLWNVLKAIYQKNDPNFVNNNIHSTQNLITISHVLLNHWDELQELMHNNENIVMIINDLANKDVAIAHALEQTLPKKLVANIQQSPIEDSTASPLIGENLSKEPEHKATTELSINAEREPRASQTITVPMQEPSAQDNNISDTSRQNQQEQTPPISNNNNLEDKKIDKPNEHAQVAQNPETKEPVPVEQAVEKPNSNIPQTLNTPSADSSPTESLAAHEENNKQEPWYIRFKKWLQQGYTREQLQEERRKSLYIHGRHKLENEAEEVVD